MMISLRNIQWLLLASAVLMATACAKGDSDLREWINVVKNKSAPPLDPLPLIQNPPVAVYSPEGLRDPFSKPPLNRMSNTGGPSPDLYRRRQPLEAYTLDTLSMVGSIGTGPGLSALVLAPDKVTYRVRPDTTLFLNVNNLAQEGPRQYMFMESRVRAQWVVPRTLKFGVDGRF